MGLDMYAYTTSKAIPAVDFSTQDDAEEIFCWRKHPNLHGWMENLYRSKGGKAESFNCVAVRLDLNDLDALEQAVTYNSLPETQGFFFGTSDGSEKTDDRHFIHLARDALTNGKCVLYTSWW
jgi:hypothetical protein